MWFNTAMNTFEKTFWEVYNINSADQSEKAIERRKALLELKTAYEKAEQSTPNLS
jgi:hypothetical protein